jgi:predicted lipoprotein
MTNIPSKKLLAMAAFVLLAGACKLWTIRPIESTGQKPAAASQTFNVAGYVDSIWESKVVPLVNEKSVELATLLAALEADEAATKKQYGSGDNGSHFLVKGTGRVRRVETASQNRTLALALPNHKAEVLIQVGPVFRGTALRDAVGFIQFNQFVNQLQFADVASQLHERVTASVVKNFDLAKAQGQQVWFAGAFTLADRNKIVITPVSLTAINATVGGAR